MRAAGSNKLASIIQRALRLQTVAEKVRKLRSKLYEVWRAPPRILAGSARMWCELIPSAGLAASANEGEWNRTIGAMEEAPIFCPADFEAAPLVQLRIVSEDPTVMKLIGMFWRARKAVSQGLMYHV